MKNGAYALYIILNKIIKEQSQRLPLQSFTFLQSVCFNYYNIGLTVRVRGRYNYSLFPYLLQSIWSNHTPSYFYFHCIYPDIVIMNRKQKAPLIGCLQCFLIFSNDFVKRVLLKFQHGHKFNPCNLFILPL